MCEICIFSNCTASELLREVLRTGKDQTYAELWEEYKTELAALDKVYRAKTMLDLRIKNLAELCPEALEMDEEENGRQLTAEEAVGMTGVLERMRQVKAEQEKDNRSAEIRIGIYKERIKGLRSAKKAAIQPDGKAAA
ncbi:hypothetical protein BD626DRAFT_540172 [Schizophyllum amplum]|uniref:Uncharacterized protein n=1 Tax=Schizophyllum amplum TaxID=97359 RepID=A0A550BZR3_9AGAR|nr:hypothetical protein BD626DRAFT_540172 [Auriculariopsis ampla]